MPRDSSILARLPLHVVSVALGVAFLAACGGSTDQSTGKTDSGAGSDAKAHDGARAQDAGTDVGNVTDPPDSGVVVASCASCPAGDLCITTTAGGGACEVPPDGGACPKGSQPPPGQCCDNSTTTIVCWPKLRGCETALTCECASALCNNSCPCMGVNDVGTLVCACEYP